MKHTSPPELGYKWLPFSTGYLDKLQAMLETKQTGSEKGYDNIDIFTRVHEKYMYTPQPDEDLFSRFGPSGQGDCDDFALAYYDELMKQEGVFPEDLYIVVGKLPDGTGHAVTVRHQPLIPQYVCFDCMARRPYVLKYWPFQPLYAIQSDAQWIAGIEQK